MGNKSGQNFEKYLVSQRNFFHLARGIKCSVNLLLKRGYKIEAIQDVELIFKSINFIMFSIMEGRKEKIRGKVTLRK